MTREAQREAFDHRESPQVLVPLEKGGGTGGPSLVGRGEEGAIVTSERVPNILIADDNREHGDALGMAFSRAGYRVATAADGQEALEILRGQPFDLGFTDLRMPRLNGLDQLRNIRSTGPEVPVVIVTAFGDWVTYADAIESGPVDYLSKPVRREDLLLAAREALGRRGIRPPDRPLVPAERAAGWHLTLAQSWQAHPDAFRPRTRLLPVPATRCGFRHGVARGRLASTGQNQGTGRYKWSPSQGWISGGVTVESYERGTTEGEGSHRHAGCC